MSMKYFLKKILEIDIKLKKSLEKGLMDTSLKLLENLLIHMLLLRKLSNFLNLVLKQEEYYVKLYCLKIVSIPTLLA
jgi:hypothetical protein